MDADQIVNSYLTQKKPPTAQNQADSIVNGFFSRQQPTAHPLDDSYVQLAKRDQGDQSYNNYCEMFAEQVAYGKTGLFPTAANAWNNYVQEGKAVGGDVKNAPDGAMIYFRPDGSNAGEGHVGFSDGQGNLVSATSQGVATIPLNQWMKMTGQQPLGYVMPTR